ncbi:MAG TPA: hypothetical protein VHC46_03695, partial [Thermodesulfobacteriota bacterium]|nr:hypothetical protein [Thermodesulfobacteriota bacterium]
MNWTYTETKMRGENWESLITEKGFMRVPRALRLKRAELGITNNEYTILLDYVDYYSFSGTMNPYRHLSEVSGMSERSIRNVLASLVRKGLLRRKVSRHGNGRTSGVVFSIAPLVKKLMAAMKKGSPTVGEEIVPHVGEESFIPNTGEEFYKKDEGENTSAKNADVRTGGREDLRMCEGRLKVHETVGTDFGFIRETGGPCQEAARNDGRPAREGDAETEGVEAGQIHLARAGKGPHGPVSGKEGEIIESGEVTGRSSQSRNFTPAGSVLPTDSKGTGCTPPPGPSPLKGEGTENINAGLPLVPAKPRAAGLRLESPSNGTVLRHDESPGRAAGRSQTSLSRNDKKAGGGDPYSPSRWYNQVWRGLYEEAAGQPALTGGREYKSADLYFRRLRALNPEMEPADVYVLAGEVGAFMIASQLEGGVFGWLHKPPDICMLASQAQSVEWHLRKMRRVISQSGPSTGSARTDRDSLTEVSEEGAGTGSVFVKFIEKIREVQDAGQQIERVYGELRGIERAARPRAL